MSNLILLQWLRSIAIFVFLTHCRAFAMNIVMEWREKVTRYGMQNQILVWV